MLYISKIKAIILILLLCSIKLQAQFSTPYALFFNNWKTINPAAPGITNAQKFDFHHIEQWSGIEGSPSDILLSYENQLSKVNSGIGITFENSQFGPITEILSKVMYNYQLALNDERTVSVGIGISYLAKSYDFDQLIFKDIDDPFTSRPTSEKTFDLDIGAVYNWNKLMIGFSIRNIFNAEIKKSQARYSDDESFRFLNTYASYNFEFAQFRITPSIFFETDLDKTGSTLNTTVAYRQLILLGASYSLSDQSNYFNFNAGLSWKNNMMLMARIYSTRDETGGILTHELNLNITIDNEKQIFKSKRQKKRSGIKSELPNQIF